MNTNSLIYRFGEFTLDTQKGCLFKGGAEVKLRPKVYETLKYLVENPGRLIAKPELMKAVWPDSFVTDDSLVQCTLELRRALEDQEQRHLKTVPRRGYLFDLSGAPPPAGSARLTAAEAFRHFSDRKSAPRRFPRRQHDLPVPRTSLVGREVLIRAASDLLLRPGVRLLTLTGPGGAGKTRLSIGIASAIADSFPGGVQFVSLAAITEPVMVETALADALEIQPPGARTIPQLIGRQLGDSGSFLLVLDNFEQVLSAATLVAETLEACPSLKVLVTSRSSLRIYGEQEFPVVPLEQSAAVELFVQRASAVRPGFSLTGENAPLIHEICARLDHLPLAIELAAARTKVLSPEAMLERLQRPLQLLTGGPLDLPARQQTLRGTIDWSYCLLAEPERKLFRRLSVFAGGCTLEAAEAVCDAGMDLGVDAMEGLSSLVDKNLVQRMDRGTPEPRFSMLETIREFAAEKLIESAEGPITHRAHAAYCLVLAEEGNPDLDQENRNRWLSRCDLEIANFRLALDWLFETLELEWGLRLCCALFRFWDMREHLSEGRSRLETMLRLAGSDFPMERARIALFIGALASSQSDNGAAEKFISAGLEIHEQLGHQPGIASSLNALAIVARDRGDYATAQDRFERSLACWRKLADRLAVARCLHNLANVVRVRGDYPRALRALREATGIFERLGDRIGAAWSMNQIGDVECAAGDLAKGRICYEQALDAFREVQDPWGTARSLTDLGYIHLEEGRPEEACTAFRESLEIFGKLHHRRGVARAIEGCAAVAVSGGDPAGALKLAGAAFQIRKQIDAPLSQNDQAKVNRALAPARMRLDPGIASRAWSEGMALSVDEAIACVLREK